MTDQTNFSEKIYVAASYPRKQEAAELAKLYRHGGHVVVSVWHDVVDEGYDRPENLVRAAKRDFENVKSCTLLVQLSGDYGSRGGRHVEFGIALALGKKVMVIGPKEHVFHYLLEVM